MISEKQEKQRVLQDTTTGNTVNHSCQGRPSEEVMFKLTQKYE